MGAGGVCGLGPFKEGTGSTVFASGTQMCLSISGCFVSLLFVYTFCVCHCWFYGLEPHRQDRTTSRGVYSSQGDNSQQTTTVFEVHLPKMTTMECHTVLQPAGNGQILCACVAVHAWMWWLQGNPWYLNMCLFSAAPPPLDRCLHFSQSSSSPSDLFPPPVTRTSTEGDVRLFSPECDHLGGLQWWDEVSQSTCSWPLN